MNILKRDKNAPSPFSFGNDDFNNLFQGFFRPISNFESGNKRLPAVNIDEKKDRYVISAELPGFDKEDIAVDMQDGVLTISAEHNEETKEKEKGNILEERRHESYYRSFDFGNNIAEKDISAHYKKGILELTLLKRKIDESKPTNVKIK